MNWKKNQLFFCPYCSCSMLSMRCICLSAHFQRLTGWMAPGPRSSALCPHIIVQHNGGKASSRWLHGSVICSWEAKRWFVSRQRLHGRHRSKETNTERHQRQCVQRAVDKVSWRVVAWFALTWTGPQPQQEASVFALTVSEYIRETRKKKLPILLCSTLLYSVL